MAEFKCKYCGNRLHSEEGQTIITCNRCDEITHIISTDNVKKRRILEEADELRLRFLYDRAMQKYEAVIQEFPKEAEAYWGYVLCIYGVEFQEDVRTKKRLPTLHRISSRNIFQDPYYQKAIEYANPLEIEDYKRVARELERIRNRFYELSQKEENQYDIFISFKQTDDQYHRETVDCSKAENLYHKLKEMGYQVFFSKVTLADRGGEDYEPIIYTALESSKVMLVVGSERNNMEAAWVRNEWSRFLEMMQNQTDKKILPVLLEDMSPDTLPEALQGIQGYNIDTSIGMDRLLSRIIVLIPKKKKEQPYEKAVGQNFTVTEESLLKRAKIEAKSGNWVRTREYYNRILDINPECSAAWIGLMFSAEDTEVLELEQYKKKLIDKWTSTEGETKTVFANEENDFVASYVVPNYFTEMEIRDLVPEKLVYTSIYHSLCHSLLEAEEFFISDQNFRNAMEYADKKSRFELTELKDDVLREIKRLADSEERADHEKEAHLKKEYEEQYSRAKEMICSRHEEAVRARENDYNDGINVKVSSKVPDAIKKLEKVGDYLEAPKKLKALLKLQEIKESVGDGASYLALKMLDENPEAIIDLQNKLELQRSEKMSDTLKKKIVRWGILGLYSYFILEIFISGGFLADVCMLAGTAMGLALWTSNQPTKAYAVYVGLHIVASWIMGSGLFIILTAIYCVSYFRKNGVAKTIIAKKQRKADAKKAKGVINAYEKSLRHSIDAIWINAIGSSYDGSPLTGIIEALDKMEK